MEETMFRTVTKLLTFPLLILTTLAPSFAGEKLRYNLVKGSTHVYSFMRDVTSSAEGMGTGLNVTVGTQVRFTLSVDEVTADGNTICVARIDSFASRVDSPMIKDSTVGAEALHGKRSKVMLTPTGKTVSVVPIDSVVETGVMAKVRGMGGFAPGEFFRNLFLELPDRPIGVGESWKYTRSDTLNRDGFRIVTNPEIEYTIIGAAKVGGYDCLKIEAKGMALVHGSGSQRGMDLEIDGTVKSKGIAFFAPKEGLLVQMEQSSEAERTMTGSGEGMFTSTSTTSQKSNLNLLQ
jgi:hypothetical protein